MPAARLWAPHLAPTTNPPVPRECLTSGGIGDRQPSGTNRHQATPLSPHLMDMGLVLAHWDFPMSCLPPLSRLPVYQSPSFALWNVLKLVYQKFPAGL